MHGTSNRIHVQYCRHSDRNPAYDIYSETEQFTEENFSALFKVETDSNHVIRRIRVFARADFSGF